MNRILLTTAAVVAAFGATYTASAQTRERIVITDPAYQAEGPTYYEYYYYRRPNSVLPGTTRYGPCGMRDQGSPNSSLNLNNRCDNEEFWRRNQEQSPQR